MENREILNANIQKQSGGVTTKRELIRECLEAILFCALGILLGGRAMMFETHPLAFALLSSCARQTPFVLIGIIASSFYGGEVELMRIAGACIVVALRIISKLYIDKGARASEEGSSGASNVFALLFSEHTYLRVMSGALGVFAIGVWRIIKGGFRFYDLFASIFYLVLTPLATWLFSWYFNIGERRKRERSAFSPTVLEERLYGVSALSIACALVFSLDDASVFGINLPVFIIVLLTLYACRERVLYGIVAGLLLGVCYVPAYAPAFAFCAIAYASVGKLSIFGGAIASCICGIVWTVYTGGIFTLATVFPALFASSMVFCTAEKIGAFDDLKAFFEGDVSVMEDYTEQGMISARQSSIQKERIRSISESFAALSEVFYNLSSKLKRPTVLDLREICESSFERCCAECEGRELCFGAEYGATLDVMKRMTLQLHGCGRVDTSVLPEEFKEKCPNTEGLIEKVNRSCAAATKKAFFNEKTEIFALDYDAISRILNDAISEDDGELEVDEQMGSRIARAIADNGYGEHSVTVFGKRKIKIFARGLDLSENGADVSSLKKKLEGITRKALSDPKFELSFGSVNMQIEARRTFSADTAFVSSAREGESVCGDTVSIFENKNDYLYALISDGMGTGSAAALTSEICNSFLRNMLTAGNKMDTSLRMLNSVLRARGSGSEDECSATVDLLQFDLYSGALSLVKSGASPTFVLRRGRVFKLASPSFPIGILRALDAKQMNVNCEDGDVIVMVSDGIMRAEDDCDYLTEMLSSEELADEGARRIADKILRRVKAESDLPPDDVSVVVVKIRRDVCDW